MIGKVWQTGTGTLVITIKQDEAKAKQIRAGDLIEIQMKKIKLEHNEEETKWTTEN